MNNCFCVRFRRLCIFWDKIIIGHSWRKQELHECRSTFLTGKNSMPKPPTKYDEVTSMRGQKNRSRPQRSDAKLSEKLPSLGIMEAQFRALLGLSQHYRIKGSPFFKIFRCGRMMFCWYREWIRHVQTGRCNPSKLHVISIGIIGCWTDTNSNNCQFTENK